MESRRSNWSAPVQTVTATASPSRAACTSATRTPSPRPRSRTASSSVETIQTDPVPASGTITSPEASTAAVPAIVVPDG
ncbi:MAG: hypothetical protein R2697_16965 [Ilumatobacteraceae bacterium]